MTPGKIGAKVVRSFKVFNVTNSDQIFQGGKPILVESPLSSFQEYSEFINWGFQDSDGNALGQNKAGHYLSFQNKLQLTPLPSNGTYMPPNTELTGVNLPLYAAFYAFTHESFVFYAPPILHDVVISFQDDLYDTVISYTIWEKYISNSTIAIEKNLAGLGLSQSNIDILLSDQNYG